MNSGFPRGDEQRARDVVPAQSLRRREGQEKLELPDIDPIVSSSLPSVAFHPGKIVLIFIHASIVIEDHNFFELRSRDAKWAPAALSHPNILAIYDFRTDAERLAGKRAQVHVKDRQLRRWYRTLDKLISHKKETARVVDIDLGTGANIN